MPDGVRRKVSPLLVVGKLKRGRAPRCRLGGFGVIIGDFLNKRVIPDRHPTFMWDDRLGIIEFVIKCAPGPVPATG
jgi:hypothetical protein